MSNYLTGQVLIVAVLIIVGKLGAILRDILLSQTFGAGLQTDAFFIANAIPSLVFAGVIATISLVFLPIYIRETSDDDDTRNQFINTAFFFYLALAAGLSLLTIVFAASLTEMIAPQATPETKALATVLTRIMALGFVFTSWVGLQNAIQQAHKAFIWPIAVPVYNHIAVIIGIIIAAATGGTVVIVVIAAILGWALQSPLQWAFARKFYKLDPTRFRKPRGDLIKKILWVSIPVFISISLDQINAILDLFLGVTFGTGAISHLSFAFRLTLLIGGIFSLPISFFVFPYLSDALKDANKEKTQRLLTRGIGLIIVLNMPMMVYAFVQADAVVMLLFERGSFGPDDAASTAAALRFYVIGALFMGLREILNRVFLADQNTKFLVSFSLVAFTFNLLSSLYFKETIGLPGIALGTTIGAAVFVILQIIYISRKRSGFLSAQLWVIGGISIVSCVAMLVALPIVHELVGASARSQIIWDIPILGITYLSCVGGLLYIYVRGVDRNFWKL